METIVLIAIGIAALVIGYYRHKLPDLLGAHVRVINAALTAILPQLQGTSDQEDFVTIVIGLLITYLFPNDEAAKDRIYRRR